MTGLQVWNKAFTAQLSWPKSCRLDKIIHISMENLKRKIKENDANGKKCQKYFFFPSKINSIKKKFQEDDYISCYLRIITY